MNNESGVTDESRTQYKAAAERGADEVVIRFPTPGRLFEALLPAASAGHVRAARREMLLAARSCLDAALESIDREEKDETPPRRINIAVE